VPFTFCLHRGYWGSALGPGVIPWPRRGSKPLVGAHNSIILSIIIELKKNRNNSRYQLNDAHPMLASLPPLNRRSHFAPIGEFSKQKYTHVTPCFFPFAFIHFVYLWVQLLLTF
uniref:Ovule protein n=1 Tax=Mesocestoides corti TaxID=53468 RepID=A0A5K3FDN4_MESCO